MTDLAEDLDRALEEVIAAARAHLAAVKRADGAVDDETVWRSYVTLNNASYAYDQLLLERYGEVTPWDTEEIDLAEAEGQGGLVAGGLADRQPEPYPAVVSVRQRRDYRVPDVAALLSVAREAAQRLSLGDGAEPPESVGDAVLELIREGDGSLAGLDLPELEPLAGVLAVAEVAEPLDLEDEDTAGLFRLAGEDRVVGRLDEEPFAEPDEDEEAPARGGER